MILVLLTRFCESEEFTPGYNLCRALVKQGHDLYVTTVSIGEVLQAEMKDANEMSMKEKGNVTLLHPDCTEDEQSKIEWIVFDHEKYFNYLQKLNDVKVIIGVLPGTEETATELKAILKCRLIILSAMKITVGAKDHASIQKLTENVDEIWSIGSDIQKHNEAIFQDVKQMEIWLQPSTTFLSDMSFSGERDNRGLNIVSMWNNAAPLLQFRRHVSSQESKLDDFFALNSALNHVSDEFRQETEIKWNIHCTKLEPIETLTSQLKSEKVKISINTTMDILEMIKNSNYVHIVPDFQDDSFNFTALTTMWLGIPTLISRQTTIGKFLQQLNCTVKEKPLVYLTGAAVTDKIIWTDKILKDIVHREGNSLKWAEELSKQLRTNLQLWHIQLHTPTSTTRSIPPSIKSRESILVLLYNFRKSQESFLGYQVCKKLAKEGHQVYVTTISTGDWLEAEIQKAEQVTRDSDGKITLLTPQFRDYEQPSPKWIACFHEQYYGYLSEHREIGVIIGTLPGTTETAIQLKESLSCRLILMATTKLTGKGELTKDIGRLVQGADELWSFGPDMYTYYQNKFQNLSIITDRSHREIVLQPSTRFQGYWKTQIKGQKIVSVWNKPTCFFHNSEEKYSDGSNLQSFCAVSEALDQINSNADEDTEILEWDVHGLEFGDQIIKEIQGHMKHDAGKITPLSSVTSINKLHLKNCQAFIVPDFVEESFNFLALSALSVGIPTLVSSESSIGKFLLRLECPEKSRAVVNLTGHLEYDVQEWVEKINTIGHESILWARRLAEYLQVNPQLWTFALFPFDDHNMRHGLSESFVFTSAPEDPVSKVENWQISHFSSLHSLHQFEGEELASSTDISSNSNDAPISSILSTSTDQNADGIRDCTVHVGYSLELFCQNCEHHICHACRPWHTDHSVLGLVELQQKLSSHLQQLKKQAKEVERRRTEISRCINSIEKHTAKAEKQMTEQFNLVRGKLNLIFNQEIDKINSLKRDQLQKLEEEALDLQTFDINRKIMEESGNSLLVQKATSNLTSHAIQFISENKLRKLPREHEAKFMKLLQYKQPKVESENISTYLKENLLGLFTDPILNQQEPLSKEVPIQDSVEDCQATGYMTESVSSLLSHREMLSLTEKQDKKSSHSSLVYHNQRIEIVSRTNLAALKRFQLRTIHSVVFQGNSMWICGWNRSTFGSINTVLINVELPGCKVLHREKKKDPKAALPTIMFSHGNVIVFAKKGGNEMFSFNTRLHKFERIASFADLAVDAMCGTDQDAYFLDSRSPEHIRILNSFHPTHSIIPTGLGKVNTCSVDMCLVKNSSSFPSSADFYAGSKDHTIILSVSAPHASVRAVNHIHGVLWQIDCRSSPDQLNLEFNPCSVSSTTCGIIFVADQGADRIYMVSSDGMDLQVLLDKERGIHNPTRVCVDKEGKRLVVINRDGDEIMNYRLSAASFPR